MKTDIPDWVRFPPFDFGVSNMGYSTTTTYPVSIGPYSYTRKDVDEAYCKGYNEGLKVHGVEGVNVTHLEEDNITVSLACGTCNSCKRLTPYADFCMSCGAKIVLGRHENDTNT